MSQSPKALFNKQKELNDQLSAVVHQDWFKVALTYVLSELVSRQHVTAETVDGARQFQDILLTFTETEMPTEGFPIPGLEHNLDPVKPTPT